MNYNFNPKTIKRILHDINIYNTSGIEKQGIYCIFDETNIIKANAIIVGPEGTPYEKGFYLFEITFPNNYPFSPPRVKYYSISKNVRINPNFYINGKVCLSILGTWAGPGWSPSMTIVTVLNILQSRLNEYPIQNEPGYENDSGPISMEYNNILKYHNILDSVCNTIDKIPYNFKIFNDIIIKEFLTNYNYYINTINENIKLDNKKYFFKTYAFEGTYSYKFLLNYIKNLYKNIEKKYSYLLQNNSNNNLVDSNNLVETKTIVKKYKYIRKCPKNLAKNYDFGFQMLSTNDNNMYEVCETKSGNKKWRIVKND